MQCLSYVRTMYSDWLALSMRQSNGASSHLERRPDLWPGNQTASAALSIADLTPKLDPELVLVRGWGAGLPKAGPLGGLLGALGRVSPKRGH